MEWRVELSFDAERADGHIGAVIAEPPIMIVSLSAKFPTSEATDRIAVNSP
jgi:hypothetical protein